jgi:hypothetical protein
MREEFRGNKNDLRRLVMVCGSSFELLSRIWNAGESQDELTLTCAAGRDDDDDGPAWRRQTEQTHVENEKKAKPLDSMND